MAQCDDCEIGLETKIHDGQVTIVPCATCQGVGRICSGCGGNPAHCDCDEVDEPPRAIKPDWIP
jgi:hypothetical protein